MGKVQVTVLLATRNRANILARVLDGYRRIAPPSVAWKLIVVDNGSADRTQNVIESFKPTLPIEMLVEPIAGKNRALNRGIEALEGPLAIVTDDDAVPAASFLTAWAKYLNCGLANGLLGGSIMALFEVMPPNWLIKHRHFPGLMFAEQNLQEGPIGPDAIYGPNMAVRRSVFEGGFRFDESIGPNALDPDYPMGSETEFCFRAFQSGVKCWFASEPLVSHIISADQISLSAMEKRAYRLGRGRARLMSEIQAIKRPAHPPLWQRLLAFSPLAKQRWQSRYTYQLWRGFEDEYLRQNVATYSREK